MSIQICPEIDLKNKEDLGLIAVIPDTDILSTFAKVGDR